MRADLLSNIYEVKRYLKESGSTNDAIIELLMDMTLGEIEGEVRRSLKLQRHRETHNWQKSIWLQHAPIMNVVSVTGGTMALSFDDDWQVDLRRRILYPYSMGNAASALNALRIEYDAGYFEARINSSNNKIDFEETDEVELTATVAVGNYNRPETDGETYIKSPATLVAAAIAVALNDVGESEYTVSYDIYSARSILSSDLAGGGGVFNLRWNTGSHAAQTIGAKLGYDVSADDTGAAEYESDYNDDCAPADLKAIFLSMCRIAWERYQQESLLAQVTSERIPDGSSITYKYAFDLDKILPMFARQLERYQPLAIG